MKPIYERFCKIAENQRAMMDACADYLWAHPELGYKEFQSTAYLEAQFQELGYTVKKPEGITGFYAELDTGRTGPCVAVIGELDAVMCETHPASNPQTHAVHACGHFMQTTIMLGVAAAVREESFRTQICGKIRFLAVPAEETIDVEYRSGLIRQGVIGYAAGKIEFIRRGFFNDVNMAFMFHADTEPEKLFKLIDGYDGCIVKRMEYKGKAAHAGGSPHLGINALYAASLGLQACNSLRETFQEKDHVRFHPIVTSGGFAANAIPELVKMEAYVRAADFDTMRQVNTKINRALAASAAAIGAEFTAADLAGNLPFHSDKQLNGLCSDVIENLFGRGKIRYAGWETQSSDVGDLSSLMPVIQPLCGGVSGTQHGEDYALTDREKGLMNPLKAAICMLYELLCEDGARALQIALEYTPLFDTTETYFAAISQISQTRTLVRYNPDGTATLL